MTPLENVERVKHRQTALLSTAAALIGLFSGWVLHSWHVGSSRTPAASSTGAGTATTSQPGASGAPDTAPTQLYAHNLMLRKGPNFRIYVRWISGEMLRTRKQVNPSFDAPDSFLLEIHKGLIRANIGDISNFLNASAPADAPLKNISLVPAGDQLVLRGTVHKMISLPVELRGTLAATQDGRVQFHLTKLDVLKLPLKWLLGGIHVQLSDLVHAGDLPGVQIVGNDVYFDTQKLLPPPHIHGQLTTVRVAVPDIEVIYGGVSDEEAELARWHNFLRLSGGTIDFGKLTMNHVDLTMIDASSEPWFDLDLVNYQAQLVNGYTRMTAQAGLEIFMPDVDENAPKKKASQAITLEWLKDRSHTLPADVPVR